MKTVRLLTIACMLLMTFSTVAQEIEVAQENEEVGTKTEKTTSFKDKLFTGGSIGLSFGDYTNLIISPVIGARLNDKVYAGLGLEYQYTKDKRYSPELTYNQFGGRLFGQYSFVPSLFAHVEFAGYSMERYTTSLSKTRDFVPFIYFGGGYRKMISARTFVSAQVLFDVLQHKYSPYSAWEPIFSIGFGVGI